MAKKDRTLYVLKYLWKNTDEDHPATVSDILAALENENIKVERHALMSDIEQLTEFGIDIVCVKSSPNRYFIGQRSFELPELKLLVDAVDSSRFITEPKQSITLLFTLTNGLRLTTITIVGYTPFSDSEHSEISSV